MQRKYIITDPSYLLDNLTWQEICGANVNENGELTQQFFEDLQQEIRVQNPNIQSILELKHTPHGDGSYFVTPCHAKINAKIFEFWVDSGLFCFCEVSNFDAHYDDDGIAKIEYQSADDEYKDTLMIDSDLSTDDVTYFSSTYCGGLGLMKIDWNDGDFDDDDFDDD